MKVRRKYTHMAIFFFRPGAMNSLAGFISTMANVYGAQHGELSTTSKVTIIVTSASTGVLGILTTIYTLWLVRRIKSQHDRTVGKQRTGKHGEGEVDLSKRKVDV
jgi:NADH:ubiquinone oxidoreductase subunit 4 (subunit M)